MTADTSGITPFVNGISVLPQGGGVHDFEIFDRQAVPLPAAYSIRVLVLETTLFAPWYYVSAAQQ